ncbi:hypothetical protein G9A89_002830 [Geosiphon pyriformis]|nr:hypothetical protein G9A89_002830 [Geosiphon pyriformis]
MGSKDVYDDSGRFELQLLGRDAVVEVDCQSPESVEEILEILRIEGIALKSLIPVALYFNVNRNQPDPAISILEQGLRTASGNPQERLPLINLLASLYIKKAKEVPSAKREEKNTYLSSATERYNEASHLNYREPITWVGKGLLYLARNDAELAHRAFMNALEIAPTNIPALFGKARVQYNHREFNNALTTYQTILKLNPNCKPDPRIGIGLCYNKLKYVDQAYMVFLRCLEVDPDSVAANILLAQMEINKMKDPNTPEEHRAPLLTQAMGRILRAHELDPKHPTALNLLANYLFYRRQFDQIVQTDDVTEDDTEISYTTLFDVAQRAERYSDTKPILAEAHYQQARAYHLLEDWDKAYYHYAQAMKTYDEHNLAHFGMCQVLLRKGAIDTARAGLERLQSKVGPNVDIITVLAAIYAYNYRNDINATQARDEFEKKIKMIKEEKFDDPQVFIEKAQLWEGQNWHKSLTAYKRAADIYFNSGLPIPPQVLNNMGVIYFNQPSQDKNHEKNYADALKCFQEAQKNVILPSDKGIALTIGYNIARTYEQLGRPQDAIEEYFCMATEHPGFVDAHLRIAAIHEDNIDWNEAAEIYDTILRHDESNINVRIALGRHYIKRGKSREGRQCFEKVLQHFDRHNIYSLLSLGSFWLNVAREEMKKPDQAEERKRIYNKALEFFKKVLQLEPKSIWAANGILVANAENNWIEEAKDGFATIRESAQMAVPDISINYAHTLMELKDYKTAIMEYESVRQKRFNTGQDIDIQLLMWLAKAYYLHGKTAKNVASMEKALLYTQKAYILRPGDQLVIYDVAVCQQSLAQLVGEQGKTERSSAILEYQTKQVECSRRLFTRCITLYEENQKRDPKKEPVQHFGFNPDLARQRVKFADSVLKMLLAKTAEQKDHEKESQRRHAAALALRAEKQRKEEEAKAREDEVRRAEALRADELQRQFQETARSWNLDGSSRDSEGRKRRRRDDDDDGVEKHQNPDGV